jgi:hypothetical protein
MAAGRGAVLLLVAVILGIVLLNKTDETPTTTVEQRETTTTARRGSTPTSVFTTSTTIALHQPAEVKVLAVNGTTTPGIGGRAKDALLAATYNALTPTDAKTKPVKTTVIYFAPGYQADATAIATLLKAPLTAVAPMPADRGALLKDARNAAAAHVIVIVGDDIAGSLPTAKPASTTSTTAKKATSSTTSTTAKSTTTTAKP